MRVYAYNTNMNLSTELPFVRLKIERKSTHPWIFQKMVEKPEQKPRPGSVVDIVDATNHWSAVASTTAIHASPCGC